MLLALKKIPGAFISVIRDYSRFFPIIVQNKSVETHLPKTLHDVECLVATVKGLYFSGHGKLTRLLPGRFYGLTTDKEFWYVFERLSKRGRIIRFSIKNGCMEHPKQLISNLSPGCHQIDFLGSNLYVTDTYNNCLLVFSVNKSGEMILKDKHYPPGILTQDREISENYTHMNSVWQYEDDIYVLFHNNTTKTGRYTEIARLNADCTIAERIQTTASNGHNVMRYNGQFLICDSMASTLTLNGKAVFTCDLFTRGLTVTESFIIVGGSDYGERTKREQLKGKLYFIDHNFNLIASLDMQGMVQEIRTLSHTDFGLSMNCLNDGYPFV